MEKLIELLNEFEKEIHQLYDTPPYEWDKLRIKYRWNKIQVISKEYGFIEWLIENDKIEIQNNCAYNTDGDYEKREIKSDYESLLMLLSIQDQPIQYLCELLK